jgi:tellurite resistance protein TerC
MIGNRWFHIPTTWSLGFIVLVLAIFALASRFTSPPKATA